MKLEYHRPDSLQEALELLQRAVPLGGGTVLTANRRAVEGVIDLARLGLDRIEADGQQIVIGAAARLQALVEAELPEQLVRTCRMEAGWNLRNRATIAGTIVSAGGRSPLLTTMLAIGAELTLEPGAESIDLEIYLDDRPAGRLITSLRMSRPTRLAYDQVARSPADRPQVCLAAAANGDALRVALGGFGRRPLLVGSELPRDAQAAERAAESAAAAYAEADDAWASGEYRAAAAGALARRVVKQVVEA